MGNTREVKGNNATRTRIREKLKIWTGRGTEVSSAMPATLIVHDLTIEDLDRQRDRSLLRDASNFNHKRSFRDMEALSASNLAAYN